MKKNNMTQIRPKNAEADLRLALRKPRNGKTWFLILAF
jgi:hypothetical protein